MSRYNFITHQNIERYRHLLKTTKDEIERRMILKLLAEEEMTQLQQGAQNEDRFRESPAITSPKDMRPSPLENEHRIACRRPLNLS